MQSKPANGPSRTTVEPRLLSVEDAGAYLAISPWTVRDLIGRGELACVRIGRRVLLKKEDLDRYIEIQTRHEEPLGQLRSSGPFGIL